MAATIPTNGIVLNSGLNVADGDITLANGHGISFSATSDGTTMSSELLDDYEEGAYTPTVTDENGGSYGLSTNSNTIQYTKIGRKVSLQGMVAVTSESSPNGTLRLSLPFTAATFAPSDDSDYVVWSMALINNGSTLGGETYLFVQPGSYAYLYNVGTDGGANYIQHDEVDTNFQFHVHGTYVIS